MENLNQSLNDAVCIDDEVFFGPITDKERKIREQFENLYVKESNRVDASKTLEDDESQNNSAYRSFSVEESKYDSFDDSLNEMIDKMPQEAKLISLRKSYDKIKSKRPGFYDSLEDVHSLVSNIDKCSISCEVENESNLNSKHFVEDSLKILSVPVANKNNFINDQVHFDDDSLAILECETTFSDSLEEVNVLESIEIEEIYEIENMSMETQNVVLSVDQNSACQKNLFDTSDEVICEKNKDNDTADHTSSDDKNVLYDSLSNSDFKDILSDSLEDGKQLKEMLHLSKNATINIAYDNENITERHNNELFNMEQNSDLPNLFDTSVQIVFEKFKDDNGASLKECLSDKNLYDSLSNSEIKDNSRDSLEESDKSKEILNISQQNSGEHITKLEEDYQNQNTLENSVQIIYDTASSCTESDSIYKEKENSKEYFENYKSFLDSFSEQNNIITSKEISAPETVSLSQNLSESLENIDADKNESLLGFDINKDKVMPSFAVVSGPGTTASSTDISNIEKEAFSVESCHLKILNDDINIDKDLKFQLHVEVTVGDKKCQISSQDIKIVPITSKCCKSENDSCSTVSVTNSLSHSVPNTTTLSEKDDHVTHLENLELNLKAKDCDVLKPHSPSEISSDSHKKIEPPFSSNVTVRAKPPASQTSYLKLNSIDSLNDVSLLQALDLSDLSVSFLNESVVQSKDSLIPLNLYSPDEFIQNFCNPSSRNKNKENIPEDVQRFEIENFNARRKSSSPNKLRNFKTPQSLQKCSSMNRKTPGTKIPVRKVDNFAVPAFTPVKFTKPFPASLSAEKVKKCQHSPQSIDNKKTGTTPNKTPHICKVRNTIFSKVPQIIPSKKYMNVQSPVAQYIKNNSGPVKTTGIDPVLQDCMNQLRESPHHIHHAHTGESLKSTKKKT